MSGKKLGITVIFLLFIFSSAAYAQTVAAQPRVYTSCTENDEGKSEFVAGQTYLSDGVQKIVYYDTCSSRSSNNSSKLVEYYCSYDSNDKSYSVKKEEISCSNGCKDGACVAAKCKTDSDCPQIYCITTSCPQIKCISGQCTKSYCGNKVCDKGEADECPACTSADPPCKAPCTKGTCPGDCKAVCGNDICESGETKTNC